MTPEAKQIALEAKGFLAEAEGMALYELAAEASRSAPCLEIGSYCGKSSIFLAEGCRSAGRHPVFCLDHHRGSAEQQPGQPYFDPELFDLAEGVFTTLQHLIRNIRRAGLDDWAIPIIADSARLSPLWPDASLSLVFIDGGHSEEDVGQDYHGWSGKLIPGGYLCFHDIYPNPADGGQAPYRLFEFAKTTGTWDYIKLVGSLGVLRRR